MKTNNSCQTKRRKIKEKTPDHLLTSNKREIYYIHILKNKRIISDNIETMRSRNNFNKQIKQFKTFKILPEHWKRKSRNSKQENLPQICPYSYRYFYKEKNKNLVHKSSFNVNSIENYKNKMESNFMKLLNESNIYTSNVKYISNKKMILFDKYKFDKNIYKPDRLKLHDMSKLSNTKMKLKKLNFKKLLSNNNIFVNKNNYE